MENFTIINISESVLQVIILYLGKIIMVHMHVVCTCVLLCVFVFVGVTVDSILV